MLSESPRKKRVKNSTNKHDEETECKSNSIEKFLRSSTEKIKKEDQDTLSDEESDSDNYYDEEEEEEDELNERDDEQ